MDSILVFGNEDKKIPLFLKKLGYAVEMAEEHQPLGPYLSSGIFDLVLIDGRVHSDAVDLCEFLRKEKTTKDTPIVYLCAEKSHKQELAERQVDNLELLPIPYTAGALVSRVATQLRLRKMSGAEEGTNASLGAMNAALRDHNERMLKEMKEAKQIQEGLLPKKLPQDPRFEIATSYQPLEDVGGDWYFVRTEGSGKVSVQIADVTGHGLSAAFIGSMTKLALCAAKKEDPAELLTEMNRLMAPQLPEGRFVTMGALLYDPASGDVNFARAGHPPAIILKRAKNEIISLAPPGFAVGFFDDADYVCAPQKLDVGDVLLLITDGISEGQNMKSENYGLDRLGEVLKQVPATRSVGKVLEAVLSDFDLFRNGRILKDDVTIVALRRTK